MPAVEAVEAVPPRWVVIPNAGWDADDKLGFGARAEVVFPGGEPYASKWVVQAFATTNGYHHHRFRFDKVGLGGREDLRLTGHFAWRAWLNDGYWGVGNNTVRSTDYDDLAAEDPLRKHYRYRLTQPFGQVALRKRFAGPLRAFVSLNGRWSEVGAYEGSLLEEERPFGIDGGVVGQVAAGLLWDTRSPEITPEKGWLLEASGRGVTGAYSFGGPFLSERGWLRLHSRAVLAERVMAEWLFGDVPFYEMVHWGGSEPIAGIGGADTIRGIPFGRWRAPGKAVANLELRLDVVTHTLLRETARWQLVPFADAGAVFGAGEEPVFALHPGVGGGVRLIYAETMVGRIDVGVGPDLTVDGPIWGVGTYLGFDHTF